MVLCVDKPGFIFDTFYEKIERVVKIIDLQTMRRINYIFYMLNLTFKGLRKISF